MKIAILALMFLLMQFQQKKPKQKYHNTTQITLKQFGAIGNGIADDTEAIIKALESKVPVIVAQPTKAYYKVSDFIILKNINNKTFIATGAKILNSDLKKATFLFQNCKRIKIIGGGFGYENTPIVNGGNSQHLFQFDNCQNVVLDKVHIINSPEMGIAITNSNYITVKNSLIEHTFRDGTYAHYSANVSYIRNIYRNIKDDAMSFHDYGVDSEKVKLRQYGYSQATNIVVEGNKVENVYQGFSSIGSSRIKVVNNKFKNLVIAGIAIFNSEELYHNGTATVNNAYVFNNNVDNACKDIIINNVKFINNGQSSTGRASIFIGSLGKNNQLNAGETKRLTNIIVEKNTITNSGADGFLGSKIDDLTFTNNKFSNCSGQVIAKNLSGDVIELEGIVNFVGNNNTITDSRLPVLHQHGYTFNNVTGNMTNWHVKGVIAKEGLLLNSKSLNVLPDTK